MLRSVLLICSLLCLCWSAFAETLTGKVVGVHDGDTCTVLDANHTEHKIRLNGVDAPELGQAFGQASKRNLSDLVFGKTVNVETGKTDRYGRLVGTVLLDGKDVNFAQLRAGLAWYFKKYERDVAADRRQPYADAEREARQARRGLWADPNPQPPWEYRHPENETGTFSDVSKKGTGAPGNSTAPAAQPGGTVRGNKNSMIYHAPNCPDYDRIAERNRVPFKTEAEAQAAGYRKARNCP